MNTPAQQTTEPKAPVRPLPIPHSAFRIPHSPAAFTLVEMIVVTGIIAVLAALIFPVGAAVRRKRDLSRIRTELMQVAMAIDSYKDKLGHFPPDNSLPLATDGQAGLHSQLFYELRGTILVTNAGQAVFQTLDGSVTFPQASASAAFGADGFINCTRGGGDEAQPAQKFMSEIRAGQYLDWPVNGGANARLLGCPFDGPNAVTDPATGRKFSFWYYNYSSPTNGITPYDLCVDVQIGPRRYRVSNWSATPQQF